ncbi:histidine kinase/DNA gyrase B/HSP90-like ATPase [Pseudomonas sp. 478]|uniref:HD domain-containing protein n=1 Tax=unclassified Pseudomonas TaxID=196821 RepID=UPI000DAD0B98|nr:MULTISPECIES: ATP-binding protein [unclassified Pseudomonas]PZX02115.1 histidine kinase/DNA gyrase B/HSP90-like ATPase [Pseudomonas sp. 478]TCV53441.1 histidine kinase/DNA gyrase B/HSP90-like ATPase [Pseudomonas sp. 460]
MADLLIRHLKKKGDEHSALSMLVNQWGFDEKLIPKALQTVSNLFPHYSRHDESHSKQILVNIERLLGENINLLSATDTWLLLEAAYWHDIGMVVPQVDIREAAKDPAFKNYLATIAHTPHHELQRFAQFFGTNDISTCFGGADSPMEAVEKLRELMAEWFRRKHADRADAIVQAPWVTVGISSPRTELIPARLFRLLGKICQMHGAPFRELSAPGGLAFRETGLAQDDCHPRFVACLLRMGDLLDLDDNRFCPVMQRIAGEDRPSITKAHEDKHSSIRHLRIDRERIEINAECETIDGYLETFKWFDWLKQEIQDQMANWQDIVPSRELGLLPTLGPINVKLSGELQILQEGQRPQFSVDGAKAFELLKGTNLYSNQFAYVREILQNAIDATLIRLWISDQEEGDLTCWDNPASAIEILGKKTISVELREQEQLLSSKSGTTTWILSVSDKGTGISIEDLGYMLKIGASQKNEKRQEIIRSMPEWMKPSGAFGIGLQSVFMISKAISIKSKSIFSNETIEVVMHSPTADKEGLVTVKSKPNKVSQDYGTVVEVEFELETYASRWSLPWARDRSIAAEFAFALDPILDNSFPYEAGRISDQIIEFSNEAPLKIDALLTTLEKGVFPLTGTNEALQPQSKRWNYVIVQDQMLGVNYYPRLGGRVGRGAKFFYRGQPFEHKGYSLPHVDIEINLLSGKAGSWLSASRDKIAVGVEENLDKLIRAALAKQVEIDLREGTFGDEVSPIFSLFIEAMAIDYGNPWSELAELTDSKWLDLKVGKKDLRALFSRDSWTVGAVDSSSVASEQRCDLVLADDPGDLTLWVVLGHWAKKRRNTVKIVSSKELLDKNQEFGEKNTSSLLSYEDYLGSRKKFDLFYILAKKAQVPYTEAALSARLAALLEEMHSNRRFTLLMHPMLKSWEKLELKNDVSIRARSIFPHFGKNGGEILLPYFFTSVSLVSHVTAKVNVTKLDEICEYVCPRLRNKLDLSDVKQLYLSLIEFIDVKVMANSEFAEEWREARSS